MEPYTHRPGFEVLGSNVYSRGFWSDWGAPLRAVQIAFVADLPNSDIGGASVPSTLLLFLRQGLLPTLALNSLYS